MITSGKWSVKQIEFVDEKKGLVFFSADKEDSTRTDLYRVSMHGGPPQRLTRLDGSHMRDLFPGGFFLSRPLFVAAAAAAAAAVRPRRPRRPRAWAKAPPRPCRRIALGKVEIFKIPASDGLQLPAVWYPAARFRCRRNGIRSSFPSTAARARARSSTPFPAAWMIISWPSRGSSC